MYSSPFLEKNHMGWKGGSGNDVDEGRKWMRIEFQGTDGKGR